MPAKFYYIVSGTMFRNGNDDTNLIEIDEVFKDDNPIIARENAFRCYQNYIDVFLESRGEVYTTHAEAVRILQDFVNSYKVKFFKIGDTIIDEFHVDYDKGLTIYLVMTNSKTATNAKGQTIYIETRILHYLDNEFTDSKMEAFHTLMFEYKLYEKYKYDCKNYRRDYDVSGLFEDPIIRSILDTPIDFEKVLADRF